MATIAYTIKGPEKQVVSTQPLWQRVVLLSVLGYEAIGCLLGGILLVAAPDGRYMNMPVDLMRGAFSDFLIPGVILLGLGILNSLAFLKVLQRAKSDWFMAGLALGGLLIWFVVEIIIIQELHWLHLMWGYPVLLGWVVAIPLIVLRHDTIRMQKTLLQCGIVSSIWYAAINIIVPMTDDGYNLASATVSELSAIGAPTRILWVLMALPYPLLFAAFGWGILKLPVKSRNLRVAGILTLAYSVFNFYWPPMHKREVIAAGGEALTDTLHLVWTMATLVFMMLIMGFGAAAFARKFRVYTIVTWLIFMVFGGLTFMDAPGVQANLPTPYIGIWERVNILAFMLWVIVFALGLIEKKLPGSANA